MSDFDILDELIISTARVPLIESYDTKKKVVLTESKYPDSSITIFNLPASAFVIKADQFDPPKSVFKDHKGECKRADYVIVADTGSEKVIVYIEVKARKLPGPESDAVKQLTGAKCFVAYCREIGREFWQNQNFLGGYNERFVCILNTSISKKPTRLSETGRVHDHPSRMMKISSPHHVQFSHLVRARP